MRSLPASAWSSRALALAVTVLALLRPTPDLRAHTDGVNPVPTGPSALASGR